MNSLVVIFNLVTIVPPLYINMAVNVFRSDNLTGKVSFRFLMLREHGVLTLFRCIKSQGGIWHARASTNTWTSRCRNCSSARIGRACYIDVSSPHSGFDSAAWISFLLGLIFHVTGMVKGNNTTVASRLGAGNYHHGLKRKILTEIIPIFPNPLSP